MQSSQKYSEINGVRKAIDAYLKILLDSVLSLLSRNNAKVAEINTSMDR